MHGRLYIHGSVCVCVYEKEKQKKFLNKQKTYYIRLETEFLENFF